MKKMTTSRDERGFTILQTVIAVAIMSVICGFAAISLTRAKSDLRMQNSVRQLAGYLEKARLDAIKRHGNSSVAFIDNSTYTVNMDFDGDGAPDSRTIPFEADVAVFSTPLPSVGFNWRGRTESCTLTFAVQNVSGRQVNVDVSDAGDVTVNGNVDVLPSVSYHTVDAGSDVDSTTVVTGSNVHDNSVDCTGSGSGTAGPPISGSGVGCTDTADPSSISIRKNGGSTAQITVHATNTGTINVQAPSNLLVTPANQTVAGGGTAAFTLSSANNIRGTFAVNFSTPCTTLTVLLTVTN
jgi:Tfp pilus assembly protein FimT